eukprot:TRINITY_DN11979_c0_g1_i2.p1 TRINITY_DN11979_c0_g1~~TRINITY_DN11979_c0_g1_i2.p1  ORF type:complete len:281 (-),score=35.60 TRINITY_DN11979_c0_g1_i2:48-890(-)
MCIRDRWYQRRVHGSNITQSILCRLTQKLNVHAKQIRSLGDEWCSNQPRISVLHAYQTSENFTLFPVFVYPDSRSDRDDFYNRIQQALLMPSWVTSLTAANRMIYDVQYLSTIDYISPLDLNISLKNSSGIVYAKYFLPPSSSPCYIYAALYFNESQAPDFFELRNETSSPQKIVSGVVYFDGAQFSPAYLAFKITNGTNITNSTDELFHFYWVATCDDPSELSMKCVTPVRGPIPVTTAQIKMIEEIEEEESGYLLSVNISLLLMCAFIMVVQILKQMR